MEKEEKRFRIVLILLVLAPVWGTLIPIIGGYLRGYPSQNISSEHSSTREFLPMGPDLICEIERQKRNT